MNMPKSFQSIMGLLNLDAEFQEALVTAAQVDGARSLAWALARNYGHLWASYESLAMIANGIDNEGIAEYHYWFNTGCISGINAPTDDLSHTSTTGRLRYRIIDQDTIIVSISRPSGMVFEIVVDWMESEGKWIASANHICSAYAHRHVYAVENFLWLFGCEVPAEIEEGKVPPLVVITDCNSETRAFRLNGEVYPYYWKATALDAADLLTADSRMMQFLASNVSQDKYLAEGEHMKALGVVLGKYYMWNVNLPS